MYVGDRVEPEVQSARFPDFFCLFDPLERFSLCHLSRSFASLLGVYCTYRSERWTAYLHNGGTSRYDICGTSKTSFPISVSKYFVTDNYFP